MMTELQIPFTLLSVLEYHSISARYGHGTCEHHGLRSKENMLCHWGPVRGDQPKVNCGRFGGASRGKNGETWLDFSLFRLQFYLYSNADTCNITGTPGCRVAGEGAEVGMPRSIQAPSGHPSCESQQFYSPKVSRDRNTEISGGYSMQPMYFLVLGALTSHQ